METWDAIRARRNVRNYRNEAIADEDLDRIVEAGWRTPSSSNQQRWAFIVVTERAQLERLSGVWRGAGHIADAAGAIAIAAPVEDDAATRESIQYDLGQATMSMMIAAADLGVGSGHAAVADWQRGAEILGIPDGWRLMWMLGLGYPDDRPLRPIRNPKRRPFDDVVHRERW